MKNIKIEKACPFCPKGKSNYIFKTYHGLYRHIWRWHVIDRKGRHQWEPGQEAPVGIRVYLSKYSRFLDIEVNGAEHINALIDSYCKGGNPSLREIDIFEK